MRTKYAYVPYRHLPGRDGESTRERIDRDAVRLDSNGDPNGVAGSVIATTDGSEPCESRRATLDGRYAIACTRADAERAVGREEVEDARYAASEGRY